MKCQRTTDMGHSRWRRLDWFRALGGRTAGKDESASKLDVSVTFLSDISTTFTPSTLQASSLMESLLSLSRARQNDVSFKANSLVSQGARTGGPSFSSAGEKVTAAFASAISQQERKSDQYMYTSDACSQGQGRRALPDGDGSRKGTEREPIEKQESNTAGRHSSHSGDQPHTFVNYKPEPQHQHMQQEKQQQHPQPQQQTHDQQHRHQHEAKQTQQLESRHQQPTQKQPPQVQSYATHQHLKRSQPPHSHFSQPFQQQPRDAAYKTNGLAPPSAPSSHASSPGPAPLQGNAVLNANRRYGREQQMLIREDLAKDDEDMLLDSEDLIEEALSEKVKGLGTFYILMDKHSRKRKRGFTGLRRSQKAAIVRYDFRNRCPTPHASYSKLLLFLLRLLFSLTVSISFYHRNRSAYNIIEAICDVFCPGEKMELLDAIVNIHPTYRRRFGRKLATTGVGSTTLGGSVSSMDSCDGGAGVDRYSTGESLYGPMDHPPQEGFSPVLTMLRENNSSLYNIQVLGQDLTKEQLLSLYKRPSGPMSSSAHSLPPQHHGLGVSPFHLTPSNPPSGMSGLGGFASMPANARNFPLQQQQTPLQGFETFGRSGGAGALAHAGGHLPRPPANVLQGHTNFQTAQTTQPHPQHPGQARHSFAHAPASGPAPTDASGWPQALPSGQLPVQAQPQPQHLNASESYFPSTLGPAHSHASAHTPYAAGPAATARFLTEAKQAAAPASGAGLRAESIVDGNRIRNPSHGLGNTGGNWERSIGSGSASTGANPDGFQGMGRGGVEGGGPAKEMDHLSRVAAGTLAKLRKTTDGEGPGPDTDNVSVSSSQRSNHSVSTHLSSAVGASPLPTSSLPLSYPAKAAPVVIDAHASHYKTFSADSKVDDVGNSAVPKPCVPRGAVGDDKKSD